MGLPAVLSRAVDLFRGGSAPVAKYGPTTGYVLPLGGGWIPSTWATNWWQQGHNPLPSGRSAVVHACVQAYAQTIAMCPPAHWNSTGDNGRARATTSALSRVLRKPNAYQSPSDFFLALTSSLYGDSGAAYGLALRNARFEITEIHLMDPRLSRPRIATTGDVFYSLCGNEIVERLFASNPTALEAVPARDVLHVRLPDPRHPGSLSSMSPLLAAELEQATSQAMVAQALAFAANQGRPSGVLETDEKLTREQTTELRALWNELTQGLNQGGTPILTHGLKWNSAIVNSRDAQLAEFLQIADQRIATAYRVPLAILSLMSGQGPQGSTESLMQFWVSTGLGFAANHIEDAMQRLFGLAGYPDDYLELDLEGLLRANFKDRIEALAQGVQGGIFAPNEARARMDLAKAEFGDEPRVQQQVVPLSAWDKVPPSTPAPSAPPPSPPAEPSGGPPNAGQRDWEALILEAADRDDRQRVAA